MSFSTIYKRTKQKSLSNRFFTQIDYGFLSCDQNRILNVIRYLTKKKEKKKRRSSCLRKEVVTRCRIGGLLFLYKKKIVKGFLHL